MRSYTIGSRGGRRDCGPYWGHKRCCVLAPFIAHCELPVTSGGHILSHDQIEAVLMRAPATTSGAAEDEWAGRRTADADRIHPPSICAGVRATAVWRFC